MALGREMGNGVGTEDGKCPHDGIWEVALGREMGNAIGMGDGKWQ